jgi:excisionase family DNA binding protein
MQEKKHTNRKRTKPMPATAEKNDKPVLTVPEAADFLRVSQSLIWAEIKRGTLKPLRLGDRVIFSRVYLERLLAQE